MALPARAAIALVVYVDERLCVDPRWRSKEVSGDLAGMRGARNGDCWIMVTIDDHKQVVWIRLVSHRPPLPAQAMTAHVTGSGFEASIG